jgi:hypothetical protein
MHTLRLALAVFVLLTPALASGAEPGAPATPRGGPRVRPNDGRSAALLIEGIARSTQLRRIIDRLEASDVIVYVETQPRLRKRVAGSLTWLTRTPQFRYVRVSLSPDYFGDAAIALLAHELQHALEVAGERSVVDPASLESFYRRIGNAVGQHVSGWDTEAARTVGDDVRRELALRRDRVVAESIQQFDPLDWHNVYRRARERAQ